MTETAIRVDKLGKRYTLGQSRDSAGYKTLRETVVDAVGSQFRRSAVKEPVDDFWALKDVSFDIRRGEVVGVIGRNGAGKSTLLKILSRITEPTEGRITIKGRVASLLEVGTGFHPELTGRENIFLNGAILGMQRSEIKAKFDEIVAFSEVERFLDTPVKRYSSGMYVRLAFAVAAHMEPEILIVDEVLAVGDLEFQKKCLGKMENVARGSGRTVIFVSHNMAAIRHLCKSTIYLELGRLQRFDETAAVIQQYTAVTAQNIGEKNQLATQRNRRGNGVVQFTSFHLEDREGNMLQQALSGSDVYFVLGYRLRDTDKLKNVDVGISFHTADEHTLFVLYSSYVGSSPRLEKPTGTLRCLIPHLPLSPGRYRLGARITVGGIEADWPQDGVGYIEVDSGDFYGTGSRGCDSAAPLLVSGQWEVGA